MNLEFGRAVAFSFPLVCAIVCLALSALDTKRADHVVRRKMHYRMIVMYVTVVSVWVGLILLSIAPKAFVWTMPAWFFMAMIGYILYFRLICTITDTGGHSSKHCLPPAMYFVVPGIVGISLLTLVLVFPVDLLTYIVYDDHSHPLKLAFTAILLVSALIYPILGLVEITRYRRREAKSVAADHRNTLSWLFGAMIAEIVALPLSVSGLLLGLSPFVDWGLEWLMLLLPTVTIYVVSCSNLLSDNYMIVDPDGGESPAPEADRPLLTRERVEQYMSTKRPWLDPAFRISDMAEDLFSNRAYISALINGEFGMNFNGLVNSYRLEELERLKDEESRGKQRTPILQLVINAGFSNYRSYLRAKNRGEAGEAGGTSPAADVSTNVPTGGGKSYGDSSSEKGSASSKSGDISKG
ncbi:MAG: hypothetical protein LBV18_01475 [Alistipes sp.]|jgi:AraC-like DNA-binding protein|nr:hypothetical protein [Alistipes sp.]